MSKFIEYFYPEEEFNYFDNLKIRLFILQAYVGIVIISILTISDFFSHNSNLFISFFSKGTALILLFFALFLLKKRGMKIAGNVYSIIMVVSLLVWINILSEDISPIYKYVQGF